MQHMSPGGHILPLPPPPPPISSAGASDAHTTQTPKFWEYLEIIPPSLALFQTISAAKVTKV